MPDQITVTGSTGPNQAMSAKVFSGVKRVDIDLSGQVVHLTKADGVILDYDLYTVATITYTVASHVATIAMS